MSHLARRHFRLVCGSLVASAFAVLACSSSSNPAAPSNTNPIPTITINANGIPSDVPFLVPGRPVRLVNNDTRPHRLHLDQGPDQPGCGGIDTSGELQPGESRVTAPLGGDVLSCAVHDHMSHGDMRFAARLTIDTGGW